MVGREQFAPPAEFIDKPESCGDVACLSPYGLRRNGVRAMKQCSFLSRHCGHTLIELIIALALGLVVTTGAVSLYRSQRAAFGRADDAIRIRDAGLTALTLIGQQVQMAGFIPADACNRNCGRPCSDARRHGRQAQMTALLAKHWRAVRTASRFATLAITCRPGRPPRANRRIASARL